MGIDLARVVEVYASASKRVGSGYIVANGLVLTAGHVVGRERGPAWRCGR